jgi:hypothetical protein
MYRIKGSDQKEYGPIPLEQVRQWISENRLNRYSLASSDTNLAWRPLSQFQEFQDLLVLQPAAIANAQPTAQPPPVLPTTPPAVPPPTNPQGQVIPISNIGAAIPTVAAEKQVLGPGIALIILGCIGVLYCLRAAVGFSTTDWSTVTVPPELPPWMKDLFQQGIEIHKLFGKTLGVLYYSFFALLHGFVVFAGFRMKRLQSKTICWIAAILTIPIYGCCCCISLPFSIWSMVILSRPEVSSRFR